MASFFHWINWTLRKKYSTHPQSSENVASHWLQSAASSMVHKTSHERAPGCCHFSWIPPSLSSRDYVAPSSPTHWDTDMLLTSPLAPAVPMQCTWRDCCLPPHASPLLGWLNFMRAVALRKGVPSSSGWKAFFLLLQYSCLQASGWS